jgi:MraZ protein
LFKGHFIHSLDAKGRLSIPAKLRKYITPDAEDSFVMIQGIDKCIDLYPKNHWQNIEDKLKLLNNFNQREQRFLRIILQNAHEDKMDAQSRILISQSLLQYAQIENEVLILGTLKKIELWNPKVYKEYLENSTETFEQIASDVMRI